MRVTIIKTQAFNIVCIVSGYYCPDCLPREVVSQGHFRRLRKYRSRCLCALNEFINCIHTLLTAVTHALNFPLFSGSN